MIIKPIQIYSFVSVDDILQNKKWLQETKNDLILRNFLNYNIGWKKIVKNIKDEPSKKDIPEPVIIEDESNQNNTDKPVNPGKDKHIDFNLYFPSNGELDCANSTFGTTKKIASALYCGTSPILLFHKNYEYIDDRMLDLTKVFPVQFPLGYGGICHERLF